MLRGQRQSRDDSAKKKDLIIFWKKLNYFLESGKRLILEN
jgi:hypothetical protein